MTSTLAMRSHPSSSYAPTPYSTSTPRSTSSPVVQARSLRLAGQDQYWGAPQSQRNAGTFVESGATPNSAYESPSSDNWTGDSPFTASNDNNSFMPTPAQNNSMHASTTVFPDQSHEIAFASSSAPRDNFPSRSPPQNAPTSSDSYENTGHYRSSSYPASMAGSTTFSNPFPDCASQTSPFTHAAEMSSSEPKYSGAPSAHMQYQPLSSMTQHQTTFDTCHPMSFGGTYRPSEAQALIYPELPDTSQVHPSYGDQHSYYPAYDDRRESITSSLSEYRRNYHGEPLNNSAYGQPAEHNATTASSPYSASPTATHTSSPRQDPSAPEPTSPRLRGVGSTDAVRRRVGIMLHTQKCQRVEQTERASIKSSSSDGRRGKLNPTRDRNDSEADEGKEALTKYKQAYERVRLQRDFYERAASSLVHQVNMLGGDPMQSSRWASKGEELDPKQARILVSSLQHEVETLREKLIQTQKENHTLRQSCDDSSRSLRGSMRGGYFSKEEEEDKAPLSAAPVTVYNHYRRR